MPRDDILSAVHAPLPVDRLRWTCDPAQFPFQTTTEVTPVAGIIGQDAAIEAMRFGLECAAHGQNVFVKGLTGTGRMTLIRRLLNEMRPQCPLALDRCYVHNFTDESSPRLITLPRCTGKRFARMADELADFIRDDLGGALESDSMKGRQSALHQAAQERVQEASKPLEDEADTVGMALVMVTAGNIARPAIFPRVEGKPVPIEQFELAHQHGQVSDEDYRSFHEKRAALEGNLDALNSQIHSIIREHFNAARKLLQEETRSILRQFVMRIKAEFPQDDVGAFLDAILNDVVEERLGSVAEGEDFTRRYRVNVILAQAPNDECPAVIENAPTYSNLIGSVDHVVSEQQIQPADHLSIRGGSLLAADGGYLVLDARDLLTEPGAWKALVRTLRSGTLEISNIETMFFGRMNLLKPEPIAVNVKVVLVGDAELYALLDVFDADFPQLFKVLAEFDSVIPRSDESLHHYASVIARIAEEDRLLPFTSEAVAALAEHGARIASFGGKLSTRFSRLADIAREAAYLARKADRPAVSGDDVRETVRRTKRRANLASRKFRELVAQGVIQVQTQGEQIGQINGLAVTTAGPLTYGFPARITATIGAGTAGIVNIERESALSGAIHTKGFHILEGLLRYLLRTDHPLVFDASIAFEQSYGGIDGDSASGAEFCCLISALTGIPIRQNFAMTGAIDQHGHIMAIGGVNEKIEGFFDACSDAGFTGTQGVLIPQSNTSDLMLRHDVVDAAREGRFHIHAVATISQAIEILTGLSAGERDASGEYPAGSVFGHAVSRAHDYWKKAAKLGRAAAARRVAPDESGEDQESGDLPDRD